MKNNEVKSVVLEVMTVRSILECLAEAHHLQSYNNWKWDRELYTFGVLKNCIEILKKVEDAAE